MSSKTIWESTLDDRYECSVTRIGSHKGELVVMDGDTELHRSRVRLSYGAIFGPDVADVGEWQEICIRVVDSVR